MLCDAQRVEITGLHVHYIYVKPKYSLKIRTANAICWNSIGLFRDYGLKQYIFRNQTVCFSRQKAETFIICLKKHFVKPHKISTHLAQSDNCYIHFFIDCLIQLQYEVSRNSFSNRC